MTIDWARGDYVSTVGPNEKIVSNIRDWEKMTLPLIS